MTYNRDAILTTINPPAQAHFVKRVVDRDTVLRFSRVGTSTAISRRQADGSWTLRTAAESLSVVLRLAWDQPLNGLDAKLAVKCRPEAYATLLPHWH